MKPPKTEPLNWWTTENLASQTQQEDVLVKQPNKKTFYHLLTLHFVLITRHHAGVVCVGLSHFEGGAAPEEIKNKYGAQVPGGEWPNFSRWCIS